MRAPDVGLEVGQRFLVLGDSFECAGPGVYFTGTPTGRPPLPAETLRRNDTDGRRGKMCGEVDFE